MKNKDGLMNLVARAERGALLDGEAKILRDAIELLDDMVNILDNLMNNRGALAALLQGRYDVVDADGAVIPGTVAVTDDDAPGRP